MRSVLIFAYYSFKDPVFQSAVLPYFQKYSSHLQMRFVLVTFEHSRYEMNDHELLTIEKKLAEYNISWHRLTWHSGKYKLFKKIYDLLKSLWTIHKLAKTYKVVAIYSEGFPGAIIGYVACRISALPHFIHTFEPHADYMLEAGVWSRYSWEFVLLKQLEKTIARHSSGILTATQGMIDQLCSWGVENQNVYQVPSCIDTDLFRRDNNYRQTIREKYRMSNEDRVIVYLGKLGGMYWQEEFFNLIVTFTKFQRSVFKFIILTTDNHQEVTKQLVQRKVDPSRFEILEVDHSQVYKYLSAADVGLVAVRQQPSKRFCSPIKTGEYLSCGLPVLVPRGISDDFERLSSLGLALLIENTSRSYFKQLPSAVEKFLSSEKYGLKVEAAQEYALKYRSLQAYQRVYEELFSRV